MLDVVRPQENSQRIDTMLVREANTLHTASYPTYPLGACFIREKRHKHGPEITTFFSPNSVFEVSRGKTEAVK
jgi:hypothetical protein